MTELEKIAYTKSFVDKLANGIDPTSDIPVRDDDVINNVRVSRCLYYVSELLQQIIANGGISSAPPQKKASKQAFTLSEEERAAIAPSSRPITVSEIADKLNAAVDGEKTSRISSSWISSYLVDLGLLTVTVRADGKNSKMPTEHGLAAGIRTEERQGINGTYSVVLYNSDIQELIFDNVDAIVAHNAAQKELKKAERAEKKSESSGKTWYPEQDVRLKELYARGATCEEMAQVFGRTEGGIRARLRRLGLIENIYDAE